ncbi:hypothetical protein J3L16_01585 [Alteromonas sp. 5E99-2]|uniref:hypothetical protein n=1 Tax=Alteromonas sp. 5E99-2 TaxID=2817683 RepID=UPI001A98E930|nr:hypothetical protein [Alteromonas sp. 5E99-2]MBO1254371.1 hypothetical protein [Alteromonas sp. 5E99-2]
MVDSVSNSSFRPPPPPQAREASLDEEQTALIQDTLSNFDANNLSSEDAASIVETFSDAGVTPSAEFASLLEESGFDAQTIGDLAGAGGPPPPRPNPTAQDQGVDLSSVADYLDSLTSESDDSLSSTDIATQIAQQFGLSEDQQLISVTA